MTPRRRPYVSSADLLASIRTATQVWSGAQDTEYFARKHHYGHDAMHVRLIKLEAAGQVRRQTRRVYGCRVADYWEVVT